jgi:hypothetical protein
VHVLVCINDCSFVFLEPKAIVYSVHFFVFNLLTHHYQSNIQVTLSFSDSYYSSPM